MATYGNLIVGLQIFQKHEGDHHGVSAEHDIIYAGHRHPDEMSGEDQVTLEDAHWFWDEGLECWYHFT